jgi:NAD(P)-dependent dehydrogenase (short-subunit alcohol dehydrogenase family)
LPKRLTGKTIVVVGAAGNLGPRWLRGLLEEGASVIGVGLGVAADDGLDKCLSDYPGQLTLGDLDITQSITLEEFGSACGLVLEARSVHGVVMSAGIDSLPGTGEQSLTDYDMAEWDRVFRVNVFGVVGVLNTLVPVLANPSSVAFLGSLYGIVSPKPALYSHFNNGAGSLKHPAYGASKAALVAAGRQYATHLAPSGIRVNTLTLGGVEAGQDSEFVRKFGEHVPNGRMMAAEDVVAPLIFLMADDSVAMTGHNLVVDGGFTAW